MKLLLILLAIQVAGHTAQAPVPCDKDCAEAWAKKELRPLEGLPEEVQADLLVRKLAAQTEPAKRELLTEMALRLAAQAPEPAAVYSIVPYIDCVGGEVMRATATGLNTMDLTMDVVTTLARKDIAKAAQIWLDFEPRRTRPEYWKKGERQRYAKYFSAGFGLLDLLPPVPDDLLARRIEDKLFAGLDGLEPLGDFNHTLIFRQKPADLTPRFLSRYCARLAEMPARSLPDIYSWPRTVALWRTLLQNEMANEKSKLLNSILALLSRVAEVDEPFVQFQIALASETKLTQPFWPGDAQSWWKKAMLDQVKFNEDETKILEEIQKQFVKAKKSELTSANKPLVHSKFWARPQSKALLDTGRDLRATYETLQKNGAWEPRLAGFLDDLKTFHTKDATEEDRLVDALERANCYLDLLGLSEYRGQVEIKAENREQIEKQLAARPPFHGKEQILDSLIAMLESEEGRWLYRQRRILWLGILKRMLGEIESRQQTLGKHFAERAAVSSNETIRLYGQNVVLP